MIGPLVRLQVRRMATPAAVAIVCGVTLLAIWSSSGNSRVLSTSSIFAEELVDAGPAGARSAWIAALVAVALIALLVSARTPDRWFRSEGDWLGTSPAPRTSIVLSALTGLVAGAAFLIVVAGSLVGILHGGVAPAAGPLLEPAFVAGPSRSIVLLPGESFEQSLGGVAVPDGGRLRVRVTPTLGGITPTTSARVSTGTTLRETIVARRAWLELDAAPATERVVVTNIGAGALAVVGPHAVELWRPSHAALGGHLRVAVHAILFVLLLASLAFGLGAWMGPGIAAALAFTLWLGASMLVAGSDAALWLPGGDGLARALRAVAEGRSPLGPPSGAVVVALVACASGAVLARSSLGTSSASWRKESRA